MRTTRSQQGNVAHTRRQNAGEIETISEGVRDYLVRTDLQIEKSTGKFREISRERTGEASGANL